MSQNPYTPRDPFGGSAPALDAQARVSGLAVASFVTSILCCVPGLGAVAAVLGIAALLGISRSGGRRTGRTLAFLGLILGILGTVFWIAGAIGIRQAYVIYTREMIAPVVSAARSGEQGDWSAYHKLLTPGASSAVTDADFAAFRDAYRADVGAFVGEIGSGGASGSPGPAPESGEIGPGDFRLPVPVQFANRPTFITLKFNSPQVFFDIFLSGQPLDGKVENFGIQGQSGIIWLIDPARKPQPPP